MVNDKWKKIVIIAMILFAVIIILIGFFIGLKGLKDFFTFIVIALLVLSLLGGAFYVVYLLFFAKTYKDIPYQFKKKLLSVTKVMSDKYLGELYLSGDTKHNRIGLGSYFYMRLNLPKIITDKGSEDNTHGDYNSKAVPIDCFIVQKKGILNKLFNEPFFVLVRPQDHDYSAIFNDVTIKAFNLVPLDSQFFTIDRRNLDVDMAKGLNLNYIREAVFDVMKDLDRLVKQAMNLDQQFQKEKEKSREFEIPQMGNMGGGNSNG